MGATSAIQMPLINLTNPLECMAVGAQGHNKAPQLVEAGKKYQSALAASTLITLFPENVQILNQKDSTEQSFVKQNQELFAYSRIFYFFKD
jgi:hypothetical protein